MFIFVQSFGITATFLPHIKSVTIKEYKSVFVLFPHKVFNRITDIPASYFKQMGIELLIIDVDNTLTTHDNPTPADNVLNWLKKMKSQGFKLIILSNNSIERVTPFAKILSLDFEANGQKPLTSGFKRIFKKLNTTPQKTAVIGDQLFTDILGGRLSHCHCIMVNMIEPEQTLFFKFKRFMEKIIMRFYNYE